MLKEFWSVIGFYCVLSWDLQVVCYFWGSPSCLTGGPYLKVPSPVEERGVLYKRTTLPCYVASSSHLLWRQWHSDFLSLVRVLEVFNPF